MAATAAPRRSNPSGSRSSLRVATRWLDRWALAPMSTSETLAAREQLLVRQWERSGDASAVANETAR